ncbi:sec-independent protein translocase protein TatB [Psychromonas marina]|uniref:Sec-independent protein translocase protein TatB n=1 Tax=Psychromonas marina TaxID=88364 RepID=A0ABQ6E602_9GAMM|nr:Sec-independent protein translocase protein TatB [Psychromonas marina]GLS92630.1 sec-independent protein translocase protein TatB [Psychromonas marina]
MFDIGFWEIALISIVGLVVLGPERLPTAIRSVMQWINTAKGMANAVKSEITEELKLHELNEMNENMIKASKDGLQSLDPDLQESINEMKKSAQDLAQPYKSEKQDKQQPLTAESDIKQPINAEQQGKKIDE